MPNVKRSACTYETEYPKKDVYIMINNLAVVQTNGIPDSVNIGEFVIVRPDVVIGHNVVIHPHAIINSGVVLGDGVEVFPGAYIGKEPKGADALSRQPVFERKVSIGASTSVGPHAVVYYDVEIGDHTLIGDGVSIREQCRIGSYCVIGRYVTINYNTIIGNKTKIMDLSHVTGNCSIGNDVFISMGVSMANDNEIGRLAYAGERVVGPLIKDCAAIGMAAILLPSVVIGNGAIVGAGAVVTKDVEPDTVVMGIPAKFVRRVGG
jgi:acetyltransferase-like isoleucine patch superfamily enzyme